MDTSTQKHWKLYIDMNRVAPKDIQTIIDMLLPGLAEPLFLGFRFLMARYWDMDKAYARALDLECAVHCGNIEVEEVNV